MNQNDIKKHLIESIEKVTDNLNFSTNAFEDEKLTFNKPIESIEMTIVLSDKSITEIRSTNMDTREFMEKLSALASEYTTMNGIPIVDKDGNPIQSIIFEHNHQQLERVIIK